MTRSEKWAMIPESMITGDFLGGSSTAARTTAFYVYCYLDLRQGSGGWPVSGFRNVAKVLGMQERTIATAAKSLSEAGVISLTLDTPGSKAAIMEVIHNPARTRINPSVSIATTPSRYRHDSVPYGPLDVQDSHQHVQPAHTEPSDPDAGDATGPSSIRSELYLPGVADLLRPMLTDGDRCENCLALTGIQSGHRADVLEYCQCPF